MLVSISSSGYYVTLEVSFLKIPNIIQSNPEF